MLVPSDPQGGMHKGISNGAFGSIFCCQNAQGSLFKVCFASEEDPPRTSRRRGLFRARLQTSALCAMTGPCRPWNEYFDHHRCRSPPLPRDTHRFRPLTDQYLPKTQFV